MKLRIIASLFLCAAARGAGDAPAVTALPSLSIAAAANFIPVLGPLDRAFLKDNPGIVVTTAAGASGSLFAQIRNGAPFDVFLSADLDYVQRLARAGGADGSSITPFAVGRLVLWTTKPGLEIISVRATVGDSRVQRLAVANPVTAPYGHAAMQALDRLGLAAAASPKIVTGENISQTAQFVQTGNADAGFVALSLVLSLKSGDGGRWIEVPAGLYDPLLHVAVITIHGAENPAARGYLVFLRSPEARKILERFGYGIPVSAVATATARLPRLNPRPAD